MLFLVTALNAGAFSASAKTTVSQFLSNVKAFVEDIEGQDDFSGDLKSDYDRAMHDYDVNYKKDYRSSMTSAQKKEYTNLKSRYTKHVNNTISGTKNKKKNTTKQECAENMEANKPCQAPQQGQQPQGQPAPQQGQQPQGQPAPQQGQQPQGQPVPQQGQPAPQQGQQSQGQPAPQK